MRKLLRALRYLAAVLLLVVSLGILAGWWIVRRALPALDGTRSLPGLQHEVIVDRDALGVPTLRADSLQDLLAAQGYVMAQDRLWQMDLLRRAAAGELSEIFGPDTLALDRENRILGLRVAAEACVLQLDAATRAQLEAYARGVNRYIEEYRDKLPMEFLVLRYRPKPWTAADSLLIHAYMYKLLTTTWDMELNRAKVEERVGPELAREMFVVDSPQDHFIVGGEAAASPSAVRAAPKKQSRVRPAAPSLLGRTTEQAARPPAAGAWRSASIFLESMENEIRATLGSNNWVVSGAHTYSGKPILANDTHLPNPAPAFWYMMHLKAPEYDVKGFALPGAPLVIIGHNQRIAWGFTNNGADVQDLYLETFNPANSYEYRVNGKWVAAQVRQEMIHIKGRADHTLEVVVTRHGPIVLRDGARAYALRWTATEPGGLGAGYAAAGFAQNWPEFLQAMRGVTGPAQNAVYADVDGNIGFIVAAKIPVRKNGTGSVPVPGDSDDFEWSGYIPFEELPQVLNPPGGVMATANARMVGPGYRQFLTDRWESPYRTDRIFALLAAATRIRPQDCITIQTDLVSAPHRFLAKQIVEAARKVKPSDPRVSFFLGNLSAWDARAEAGSRRMAFVEYTRRELWREILRPKLGADTNLYDWWRRPLFFENVLRRRPPHWLPKEYPTYDALLMASADRAVRRLEQDARAAGMRHAEDPARWRWGFFLPLRMHHPLAQSGWLSRHLSISGVDQSGSSYSVKQTGRTFGPAMRFVADLANLDNSLMNVAMGQSGHYLSPHYRDQFSEWYWGRGIPSQFSNAAEEKGRRHRLRLVP